MSPIMLKLLGRISSREEGEGNFGTKSIFKKWGLGRISSCRELNTPLSTGGEGGAAGGGISGGGGEGPHQPTLLQYGARHQVGGRVLLLTIQSISFMVLLQTTTT